jgi:glycosyltransferase involved in cell wall biosynthesis
MPDRIGIGIITYNRKDLLRETIRCVRKHTRRDDVDFVVADDGSTDGTLAMLREENVPVVTGVNMGIAWNKNRALYLLAQIRRCDPVILLEDDTQPNRIGWESAWVEAAERWGHVNYAGAWLREAFVSGTGTPADPAMSKIATAQCSAYSRASLDYAGYFDSRFKGFGHEHVEHSRRLIRAGYGGTDKPINGQEQVLFSMITSDLTLQQPESHMNADQVERNLAIATTAMADHSYRAPWRDVPELRQFRAEMKSAVEARPGGFALRDTAETGTAKTRKGGFSLWRLFGRRG